METLNRYQMTHRYIHKLTLVTHNIKKGHHELPTLTAGRIETRKG